ncbi:MAG: SIMPL domain-containing protein, partial [Planctomycetota bacterium]
NDKSLTSLVTALRTHRIAAEDIETGYVRVIQSYDHTRSGRVFEGYEVTRTVILTLREVDSYSAVLTTCLEAGATHIDYVSFRTTQMREHRDAARAQAARAARDKAAALATELGASVGEVIEIEELSGWFGRSLNSNTLIEATSTANDDSTSTGLVSVKSAVRVTFEIQ